MEDYETTLSTVCNYIGDRHPWIPAAMAQKHKLSLSNKLKVIHNNTVAYGPFKGLKFIENSHWGAADKGTMILGLYEQELLNELGSVPAQFDIFVDLGAADGYYGIGVLVNQQFKKSYCYEITDHGREVIKETALANGVVDKVLIRGEATKEFVNEIPKADMDRAVLFVDIEGGEFDLFNKNMFASFNKSIIFVELHHWFFPDGEAKLSRLIDDSKATHRHQIITMGSRDLSAFAELKTWNDLDRWLVVSEGRAQLMSWVRFDPLMS